MILTVFSGPFHHTHTHTKQKKTQKQPRKSKAGSQILGSSSSQSKGKGLITLPPPVGHTSRQGTRLWPSPTLSFPGFPGYKDRVEAEFKTLKETTRPWGGRRGRGQVSGLASCNPKKDFGERGAPGSTAQFRALR